jgi:hypothetical protein
MMKQMEIAENINGLFKCKRLWSKRALEGGFLRRISKKNRERRDEKESDEVRKVVNEWVEKQEWRDISVWKAILERNSENYFSAS